VLAPTVSIHGASFVTDPGAGPLLPAAAQTTTPLITAENVAATAGSSWKLSPSSSPSDSDSTSTPSASAVSTACMIGPLEHPCAAHTR
jgi:hypothetical protein